MKKPRQSAKTKPQTPEEQWAAFFAAWQSLVTGRAPSASMYRHFFTDAGKGYFDLLVQLSRPDAAAAPEKTVLTWADTMDALMDMLLAANAQPLSLPPQTIEELLSAYSGMPGFGFTAEKQADMNLLYTLWTQYEEKSRAYNTAMTGIAKGSLEKFRAFVAKPPKHAKPLESAKDIYLLFIDYCEEDYARYALGDDYARLYGGTVNALSAYKKQLNKVADTVFAQMNLPTRQELDALHARMHALRRENVKLKKSLAALKKKKGGKK